MEDCLFFFLFSWIHRMNRGQFGFILLILQITTLIHTSEWPPSHSRIKTPPIRRLHELQCRTHSPFYVYSASLAISLLPWKLMMPYLLTGGTDADVFAVYGHKNNMLKRRFCFMVLVLVRTIFIEFSLGFFLSMFFFGREWFALTFSWHSWSWSCVYLLSFLFWSLRKLSEMTDIPFLVKHEDSSFLLSPFHFHVLCCI